MKKYIIMLLMIASMVAWSGYALAAAGGCCPQKACACAKGECCTKGQCSCEGSCCVKDSCTCMNVKDCVTCKCRAH